MFGDVQECVPSDLYSFPVGCWLVVHSRSVTTAPCSDNRCWFRLRLLGLSKSPPVEPRRHPLLSEAMSALRPRLLRAVLALSAASRSALLCSTSVWASRSTWRPISRTRAARCVRGSSSCSLACLAFTSRCSLHACSDHRSLAAYPHHEPAPDWPRQQGRRSSVITPARSRGNPSSVNLPGEWIGFSLRIDVNCGCQRGYRELPVPPLSWARSAGFEPATF